MKKRSYTHKFTTGFFLVALVGLSIWFVRWRMQVRSGAPPPGHLVAVWDTSTSVPRNCDALVATVKSALTSVNVAKGSRFALITTGSTASQFEPVLALDIEIPGKGGSIYSGTKAGTIPEAFFNQVQQACREFGSADGSSIFRAVEIAIEHVRTFGCTDNSNCRLVISTDLEETINDAVRKRLSSNARSPAAPALLDNTGISLTFCGYTETNEAGGPRTEAPSLVEGWKRLFKHPVTFQPYCATSENKPTTLAGGQ